MTRPEDISMKERPAKTLSPADKWTPNIPFHVTQEELWEHIHEIERGPFIPVEECFKNIRQWMERKSTRQS
ncbi:MAG TPA: hypothetical protein H9848_06045 [Candidatus Parabacteroides intestinigallinarum]|uniref:Uncharacterized protein n=1 Tax=Candidatus Parabacteroides intestinigallinarum TaxID=2838722 RepID=A0A9D1XRU0_9BACT|nr:hypothetical protein [Candidatus Parabacteroides intestinigallinarum]